MRVRPSAGRVRSAALVASIDVTTSEHHRTRPSVRIARRVFGVVILAIGCLVAVVAGAFAILLVAAELPSAVLFLGAGLVVAFVVALLIGRAGSAVAGRGWRPALIVSVAWSAALALLFGLTFLQPFPVQPSAPVPAGVAFWELPDGSRLAYTTSPATGPTKPVPVVFLHGGPGTPSEGLPYGTAELNAAGYDVYSYDQIGAGRSTRLSDVTGYTVERNVADLEAVRELIGAERLIVIGQSWGGSLAAQYLAAHPDRVDKVVFTSPGEIWPAAHPDTDVDPWGELTGADRERYDELTSDPRFLLQSVLLENNPQAAHSLIGDAEADSRLHEIAVTGRHLASCPGGPPGDGEVHQNPQGFYTNQMTNADFETVPDPRPALQNLDTPALVLRAECDYVPWVDTRDYRDALPASTLVYLPGAGHGITDQAGPAYLEAILGFLAGDQLRGYDGEEDPSR